MATKTKKESPSKKTPKKKNSKKRKLNQFTEERNHQSPVEVKEIERIEEVNLPETRSIVPIREFAMPLATPDQLKKGMELYQQLMNALIKTKDIVLVDGKPHGKKIAVNKINRVFGVSTEVLRSFMETHIADKDYWSKGARRFVVVKKGEKYLIAKAWVKAILPNGQFCTRGAAVSETERRFAHTPHDLMATAETRAMKNAATNLLGVEFEMVEEEETEQKPNEKAEGKTYNPKPSEEQGYKHSGVVNPKMPASLKQKEFINILIDKLRDDYEVETQIEKPVAELNKGEAANLINKLIVRGKEAKKNLNARTRKEIPVGESPEDLGPDDPIEEP